MCQNLWNILALPLSTRNLGATVNLLDRGFDCPGTNRHLRKMSIWLSNWLSARYIPTWSMTFLTKTQAFHNFLGKNQQKNELTNYFHPPLIPVLFEKIKAPTRNLTNPEIVKITCSYFWVLSRNLSEATLNILIRRIICSTKIL